jgi:hypothetical protein
MKRMLFYLILAISFNITFSQSVRVEVSGLLNLKYIQFDSLKVMNTRTYEVMKKYYPDTILYSSSVGMEDYQQNAFLGFESNYINPYIQETNVTLNVTKSEIINISLNDISGRIYQTYSRLFNPGIYKFRVSAINNGFFVLNAKSKSFSNSIKLIQTSPGSGNLITLIEENQTENPIKSDPNKSDDSDFFNIGDTLIISGYYNNEAFGKTVVMDRNGYAIISFGIQQFCDSIDLIGEWSIVSKSFFDIFIQDDYNIPIQSKLNFLNDTVVTSLRLEPYTEGDWFYGAQNNLYYKKYKLFKFNNIFNLSFYDNDIIFDINTQPNFLEDFNITIVDCNLLILNYSPNDYYQFLIFKTGGLE